VLEMTDQPPPPTPNVNVSAPTTWERALLDALALHSDATGFKLVLGDADLLNDEHGTVPLGI
jgi:hypothetical protein